MCKQTTRLMTIRRAARRRRKNTRDRPRARMDSTRSKRIHRLKSEATHTDWFSLSSGFLCSIDSPWPSENQFRVNTENSSCGHADESNTTASHRHSDICSRTIEQHHEHTFIASILRYEKSPRQLRTHSQTARGKRRSSLSECPILPPICL